MISLRANTAEFQKEFQSLITQVANPRLWLTQLGDYAAGLLRAHFIQHDATYPNQLNPGRRTHLWLRFAQSIQPPVVSESGVSITITDPILAHKIKGGPITARRAKYLSIPLEPETYALAPREFAANTGFKLFVLRAGSNLFLVRRAEGQGLVFDYLLKRNVNQPRDIDPLPNEQTFLAALLTRGQALSNQQLARN